MATHPNSRHKLPKLAPASHGASSQTRGTEGLGKRKATEILPLFAQHYMGDCRHNSTAAAIAIGANPRSAHSTGYHLLKKARESGLLAEEARKVIEKVELTTEGALRQVARILHADPARLFDEHGNAIPIHLLDEDTRAAIASFEYDELGQPKGEVLVKGRGGQHGNEATRPFRARQQPADAEPCDPGDPGRAGADE